MLRTILPILSLAIGTPASAAIFDFSGTRENMSPGTLPGTGRCVPTYFSTTEIFPGSFSSTGTSNFGNFTATLNHCNLGPAPTTVVDGFALLEFDLGDSLFATYTGSTALTGVPGTFSSVQQWIVTGGTGRFLNASGTVSHAGSVRVGLFQGTRVGIYEGNFTGSLALQAVPEPSSWAMMIVGFGMIGAMARRRPAAFTSGSSREPRSGADGWCRPAGNGR